MKSRDGAVDDVEHTLKVQEAAKILHVHPNTLRRWSDQGIIRTYRLGPRGDRRFMQSDIIHLLAKLKSNGGNPKNVK